MGATNGKPTSSRPSGSTRQQYGVGGHSPAHQYQPQTGFTQQPPYTPQHPQHPFSPTPNPYFTPPSPNYAQPSTRLDTKYARIADNYRTLDEVTAALSYAGLESSNLIVGIDFTKSNEWTGAKSFNRRSLHHIGQTPNPYEQAIAIIGQTLSAFDDDNLIPCYGFGDASTHDKDVFSFYDDNRYCQGFEEVLARYRELVPQLRLAGPTSFAPIIEMATTIVEQSGGQYHVLLIIADGQVTRSVDTGPGQLSPQEQSTIEAMIRASEYPLSIVLVGVGDGPWDMMMEYDDNVPSRAFDNFQFVDFTQIMSQNADTSRKQTEFALSALMEIPSQYRATQEHRLLGRRTGRCPERVPLAPPRCSKPYSRSNSFQQRAPEYTPRDTGFGASSAQPNFTGYSPRDTGFGASSDKPDFTGYSPRDTGFGASSAKPDFTGYTPRDTGFGARSAKPDFTGYTPRDTGYGASSAKPDSTGYTPRDTGHGASSARPYFTSSAPPSTSTYDNQLCPICIDSRKDMAFGCGHQTCRNCGEFLDVCPICRSAIKIKIRLHGETQDTQHDDNLIFL